MKNGPTICLRRLTLKDRLRRLTLKDRLMEIIFPSRKREREKRVDEAMRVLMADFEEPCFIDDVLLPDGKGTPPRRIK